MSIRFLLPLGLLFTRVWPISTIVVPIVLLKSTRLKDIFSSDLITSLETLETNNLMAKNVLTWHKKPCSQKPLQRILWRNQKIQSSQTCWISKVTGTLQKWLPSIQIHPFLPTLRLFLENSSTLYGYHLSKQKHTFRFTDWCCICIKTQVINWLSSQEAPGMNSIEKLYWKSINEPWKVFNQWILVWVY